MRYFILFILISGSGHFLIAQNTNWKLEKDEKGIKIYTRHVEGFDIDEIKSEMVVNASLASVVTVIMDADHFEDWIYAVPESHIINKVNDTEQYQYQINDLPYPFSDRDIVIHFKIWKDPQTQTVHSSNIAAPDYIPETEGRIRVPVYFGGYDLTALSEHTTKVSFHVRLDPGGSLPDWLVNWFIVRAPYESSLKMRERIESGDYRVADLGFLK